jgi:hypothetical protein
MPESVHRDVITAKLRLLAPNSVVLAWNELCVRETLFIGRIPDYDSDDPSDSRATGDEVPHDDPFREVLSKAIVDLEATLKISFWGHPAQGIQANTARFQE